MIGHACRHRGRYWPPFLGRAASILGWDGAWEFLPQTPMRATEVIISKGECELMLQIQPLLGKGVHLTSQPARVLADRQVVAFHAVGGNAETDRRIA